MSIQLKNVSKNFSEVNVLDSINLSINKGEIIGLLGTSGCGKSTLLRAISGLDQNYSGTISINGNQSKQIHEGVQFIFQEPNLFPWFTVEENVNLGVKGDRQAFNERAKRFIDYVGLNGKEDYYPKQLSGGMAQRVAIARALVNEPKIIMADEPTGNLDTKSTKEIMEIFEGLNSQGNTIILVTHEPEIAACASRQLLVRDGKITKDAGKGVQMDVV